MRNEIRGCLLQQKEKELEKVEGEMHKIEGDALDVLLFNAQIDTSKYYVRYFCLGCKYFMLKPEIAVLRMIS